LPEPIPPREIPGSALQQELPFEKAHVSQPFINISQRFKHLWNQAGSAFLVVFETLENTTFQIFQKIFQNQTVGLNNES